MLLMFKQGEREGCLGARRDKKTFTALRYDLVKTCSKRCYMLTF